MSRGDGLGWIDDGREPFLADVPVSEFALSVEVVHSIPDVVVGVRPEDPWSVEPDPDAVTAEREDPLAPASGGKYTKRSSVVLAIRAAAGVSRRYPEDLP